MMRLKMKQHQKRHIIVSKKVTVSIPKKPSAKTDAQSICLEELIDLYKGPKLFAERIGEKDYTVINWKKLGAIPLIKAGPVARKLSITPLVLNYKDVKTFLGEAQSWKAVVESVGFSLRAKARILAAGNPK